MARNQLEERLEIIRNQKALYNQKIKVLQKEEIEILVQLGVLKDAE